jgi:hypothetical protein
MLLILLAAAAWLTRDRWSPWIPRARAWIGAGPHAARARPDSVLATTDWQSVTPGGESHAERLLLALGERGSPPYTMLLPSDFAAFMLMDIAGQVPPSSDSTEAAIVDRALAVRTSLDIKALGGRSAFGPIGAVLADREPMTLAGTFDVVRPGVAEFHVRRMSVHGLPVPTPLIPDLVRKFDGGQHPAGLASDALLLNVPRYVADIRIVESRIAIYRTIP